MKEYRRVKSDYNLNTSLPKGITPAGAAGRAIGESFGKIGNAVVKAAVDLPVAMADGLHNMPNLYGDKVRQYDPVTGWKSGGVIGVKVCDSMSFKASFLKAD